MDPNYFSKGLGNLRMRFPDAHQDIYTAAANAVHDVIERNRLEPDSIGEIRLATESSLSLSHNYVSEILEKKYGKGSFCHCNIVQYQAACRSSTDAIQDSLRYISNNQNGGKLSVVVASDWANYIDPRTFHDTLERSRTNPEKVKTSKMLRSAGTGGFGAVALLISEDPRCVAIESAFGVFNETTCDHPAWYKPIHRFTPVVNGSRSESYLLNSVKNAVDYFKAKATTKGAVKMSEDTAMTDQFDYMIPHLPYAGMAKKVVSRALAHEWRDIPKKWWNITEQIGQEPPKPRRADFADDEEYQAAFAAYSENDFFKKQFPSTPQFKEVFERKVAPAIEASRYMGNTYTGSLWFGLASVLENEWTNGKDLTGKWIGTYAYGSECGSKTFKMVVQPEYSNVVPDFKLMERLKAGTALKPEQWEMLLDMHYRTGHGFDRVFWEKHEPLEFSVVLPDREFALIDIGSHSCDDVNCPLDDDEGYRYYTFVE
jgi:hydroxymethylglutaryl-CoA synthase